MSGSCCCTTPSTYQPSFKENRGNCGQGGLSDTSYQILKFILVYDGSKWLITSIVAGDRVENQSLRTVPVT